MHIHDAIGEKNHLPLFSREIDLNEKLNLVISRKCTCVIETKTAQDLKKSILELKKLDY